MSNPKKKICFITNPVSGLIQRNDLERKIEKHIDKSIFDYKIVSSEYAGHATEIAADCVADGYDIVVAVGGDGSVNEVAQSLVNTKVTLGIIPLGSGNGLAGHLGLKARRIIEAVKVLNTGKEVVIDTGKSNSGFFVSNAGFGFDSHVVRMFKTHKIRGIYSYVSAIIKQYFFSYKPVAATITFDDEIIDGNVFFLTAFNSSQYGYGIGIIPKVSSQDGMLDLLIVKPFAKWKGLIVGLLLILRKPHWIKEATVYKTKEVKIKTKRKLVMQHDGDHFKQFEEYVMRINPRSLKVIVPNTLKEY